MSWALGSDHSVNVLKYIFVRKYVKEYCQAQVQGPISLREIEKETSLEWLTVAILLLDIRINKVFYF